MLDAPPLDETRLLDDVGVPLVVVVIKTSYDVGEPDHPEVDAVITLPAVLLPVKDTVPPDGTEIAVHLAYIVILDGGVNDPPDAIGPYVKSKEGVL